MTEDRHISERITAYINEQRAFADTSSKAPRILGGETPIQATDLVASVTYVEQANERGEHWLVAVKLYAHGWQSDSLTFYAQSLGDALTFVSNVAQGRKVSTIRIDGNLLALNPLPVRNDRVWTTEEIIEREA